MRNRLYWLSGLAFAAALVAGVALWAAEVFPFGPEDPFGDEFAVSADLASDLKLMWQTRRLPGRPDRSHGENPRASTTAAVRAASRVFNTVGLVGLTRQEVLARIGDPDQSSDSIYNFPFHPVPAGVTAYRFDTGSYGWQFNLYFDRRGKVLKVERLGIE